MSKLNPPTWTGVIYEVVTPKENVKNVLFREYCAIVSTTLSLQDRQSPEFKSITTAQ